MEDKLYVLFSVFACASCGQGVASFEWKPTGMAFCVPIVDVSVVDLSVRIEKPATYEQVKAAIKEESESKMKGILCYTKDDVVSTDFVVEKSQIRMKGDGEMKHLEAAGSEGSKDE